MEKLKSLQLRFPLFAIVLVLIQFLYIGETIGQNTQTNTETIPLNPNVRYGKFDNGLTYYILKNTEPQDKVELRLVVNVGSVQEDDNQLGLAHFMEHMNFNGTKNFEKNELVDYLQSVGVKFGAHLNAYTSFDETVYMLTLPTENQNVIDTGFQVLEDWAHNALLTDDEIDKERGVVLEEYRTGLGARKRMMKNYLPKLLYESKYANRLPIGTEEVLSNFEYETIREFYRDWYRPDLMAVVVVGDIDVDAMEAKVKTHFSGLKNPKKAREREIFEVPNHEETFVVVESDVEQPYSIIYVYFKDPKPVKKFSTVEGLRKENAITMFSSMLNNRIEEIINSADPPFSNAVGYYGSFAVRTKNAFQMVAITAETAQIRGLEALLIEAQRIKHHGFTKSELERAKKSRLAYIEKAYNERDKTPSRRFASEFIRNFLEKEPAPGITWEYEKTNELVPAITLDEVNALINSFISDENRVVILLGPEKEGLEKISEESIQSVLDEMDETVPEPYQEEELASSLIETKPLPGKIVNTEVVKVQDFKRITLSNGMRISYKVTDFKNDEILMRGFSYGGTSTFTDEEYYKTHLGIGAVFSSGVGDFSEVDLKKVMAGKIVRLSPSIGTNSESFNGSTTPKDLETMFQLIRLYFTSPRKDKEAFESYITRNKNMYANLKSNPQTYFSIEHGKFLNENDTRHFDIPSDEEWAATDLDMIMKKYKEAFANPGDFQMFFVGNIDEEAFLEYSKTYLATIPGIDRKDVAIDRGVRMPKGTHEKIYKRGLEQKSFVTIDFEDDTEFILDDRFKLSALGEILTIKLIEILREEKGGVYGVGARGSITPISYPRYEFKISFPCGPENAIDLKETALAELNKILENGPEEKDLNKVKEQKRKALKENLRNNRYWVNRLWVDKYDQLGEPSTVEELYQRIEDLTVQNIQAVGKKYLSGDYVVGILMPEDM
ncbi:MAG: insulinase family protein [Cyclobacteriaceae bacterium]